MFVLPKRPSVHQVTGCDYSIRPLRQAQIASTHCCSIAAQSMTPRDSSPGNRTCVSVI